ncbi:MAG: hypothetical protein SNJ71_02495, partial [Bacteroidales bacterium]
MKFIINFVLTISIILNYVNLSAQIFENKTITFNVETVTGQDKNNYESLGLKYVILFSNDTIYPLLVSNGTANK